MNRFVVGATVLCLAAPVPALAGGLVVESGPLAPEATAVPAQPDPGLEQGIQSFLGLLPASDSALLQSLEGLSGSDRTASVFVLEAVSLPPEEAGTAAGRAGLNSETARRLEAAARRVQAAAAKDPALAAGLLRLGAEARARPRAVLPAEVPDNWKAFLRLNRSAAYAKDFEILSDGGMVWRQPFRNASRNIRPRLKRLFPDLDQPVEGALVYPTPIRLAEATRRASGFGLAFPEPGRNRSELNAAGYLRVVARGEYPMIDLHDLHYHWPYLIERSAAEYADIAGVPVRLEVAPFSASLGPRALKTFQQLIGVPLDRNTSEEGLSRPGDFTERLAEYPPVAGLLRRASASSEELREAIFAWLESQGPFGRSLAARLGPRPRPRKKS